MVLTNVAIIEIRDWLAGNSATAPTHINVGDGSTSSAPTDTALESEIGTRNSVDTPTTSTQSVKFTTLFDSTDKNGESFREVGLFNASTSGDMFARGTHTVISKTASIEVQYEITIALLN